MIEVKLSATHGRGVFATQDIPKGTIVAIADVILFPVSSSNMLRPYRFPWESNSGHVCLCMHPIAFTNHNEDPNIKAFCESQLNLTKTFVAIKDIKAGDELFLCYGYKVTF